MVVFGSSHSETEVSGQLKSFIYFHIYGCLHVLYLCVFSCMCDCRRVTRGVLLVVSSCSCSKQTKVSIRFWYLSSGSYCSIPGFGTRFSGDYLHFSHFGTSSVPFRFHFGSISAPFQLQIRWNVKLWYWNLN